MKKPKVAFFDFTCCEGCQLQLANLGEELLKLLGVLDVVEFREIMSEKWDGDFDVAIVEGSITDAHGAERIKKIRERCQVLIAYGSCATIGGVNGIKNSFDPGEIGKYVYGSSYRFFPTEETKPLHEVVRVDYSVNGCPIYLPEFNEVIKAVRQRIPYHVPDDAVCMECRKNENVCLYERGVSCLGPLTRGGCNSWCVNNGNICFGCRGMVSNPNEKGLQDVLTRYNVPLDQIMNRLGMYNKCREKR